MNWGKIMQNLRFFYISHFIPVKGAHKKWLSSYQLVMRNLSYLSICVFISFFCCYCVIPLSIMFWGSITIRPLRRKRT